MLRGSTKASPATQSFFHDRARYPHGAGRAAAAMLHPWLGSEESAVGQSRVGGKVRSDGQPSAATRSIGSPRRHSAKTSGERYSYQRFNSIEFLGFHRYEQFVAAEHLRPACTSTMPRGCFGIAPARVAALAPAAVGRPLVSIGDTAFRPLPHHA